jgi:hypothetical protein
VDRGLEVGDIGKGAAANAWRVMMPKKISTMFSHEQLVGVKCSVILGSPWGSTRNSPRGSWSGWGLTSRVCATVLTISRLKRWSPATTTTPPIRPGSRRWTAKPPMVWANTIPRPTPASPTWLIVGDQVAVAGLCGLDAAALAVHGFDLTFAAPAPILRTRRQLGVH